jgi:hypothetical protein
VFQARLLALALLAPALAGCDVELSNNATVYPPVSGLMEARWQLGVKGIREVDYTLDGQPIGSSSNASTTFAVQLDSAKFSNGAHLFRATAIDANGQAVQAVEHTLMIQN